MNTGDNYEFGFTDDGLIYMAVNTYHDNEPCRILLQWGPQEALDIAEKIKRAFYLSQEKAINERNRADAN